MVTTLDTNVEKKSSEYKTPSISAPQTETAPRFLQVSFPGLPTAAQSRLLRARQQPQQTKLSGARLFTSYPRTLWDAPFSLGLCRASETASLRQSSFVQTHSPITLCSETTALVLWQRTRKKSSGCVLLFHHHQEPTEDGNTLQQILGNI